MARPEKVAEVEAIAGHLAAAQSVVLADYHGITVEQMTEFRSKCREQNIVCRVVKNRLAKIAADQAEVTELKEYLVGPIALIMGPESQVDPAKLVVDFAKDVKALEIKGGFVTSYSLRAGRQPVHGSEPRRALRQDDGQHQFAADRNRGLHQWCARGSDPRGRCRRQAEVGRLAAVLNVKNPGFDPVQTAREARS